MTCFFTMKKHQTFHLLVCFYAYRFSRLNKKCSSINAKQKKTKPLRVLTLYIVRFVSLQHLADDLGRLAVCLQQFLALFPLFLDAIVLIEELLKEGFLIERADEAVLHHIFAVVDEQVHNGLGDLVGNGFAYNVKVRGDKRANEFRLHGLAVGECGFVGFTLF